MMNDIRPPGEKIIIVGAGPAGLAVAGRLRQHQQDFTMLERDGVVASMWHQHYDRLHLHTVKELSHLPHLPFPAHYPRYVSRQQLADYCQSYAQHFNIQPIFGTEVIRIRKDDKHWEILTSDQKIFKATQVVIATGCNRIPVMPHWSGQEDYSGEIIHSRFYKNPVPYTGLKVLVIGMGNTGAEIALDLADHGVETYLSVRSHVNIVPRDVLGRPAQLTGKMLEKLPFGAGRLISRISTRLILGDLRKFGLQPSPMDPVDQLKLTGQTPVIDLGTVAMIKAGKIKIVPDVNAFTTNGVILKNGDLLEVDAVILATGYQSGLTGLLENADKLLDQYGLPRDCMGRGDFQGLYFVGFDNYKLGGILGTIYTDSEKVVYEIVEQNNSDQ